MKNLLIFLFLFPLLINCISDKTPLTSSRSQKTICDSVPWPPDFQTYTSKSNYTYCDGDTLEVVPGVFLISRGISGDYSISQVVRGRIILKNISSDSIFKGAAAGDPYYQYYIEDSEDEFIVFSPFTRDPVIVRYNLKKGDSTYQDFTWYQGSYNTLKVYAKPYFMYVSLIGHDSLNTHFIRKRINILAQGDRFSVDFKQNSSYPDCYVYDFFIRNRFPDDTLLTLIQPYPLTFEWYSWFPDSLIKVQKIELLEPTVFLKGFTTWRYRLLIDFENPELLELDQDSYKIKMILQSEGRIFCDSTSIYRLY